MKLTNTVLTLKKAPTSGVSYKSNMTILVGPIHTYIKKLPNSPWQNTNNRNIVKNVYFFSVGKLHHQLVH